MWPVPDPAELLAAMPFAVAAGVVLVRAEAAEVTGRLPWAPERCTAGGVLHGGALMTLADSVGAVCAFLNLPAGATTSTVASSTSLMRAVRGGSAHATARPLHAGRSFVVVSVEITDDEGRRVAQVTQTQAVLAG
jgi:1,4-dihydroxy-2-naphthoyl-CoA hydrolase